MRTLIKDSSLFNQTILVGSGVNSVPPSALPLETVQLLDRNTIFVYIQETTVLFDPFVWTTTAFIRGDKRFLSSIYAEWNITVMVLRFYYLTAKLHMKAFASVCS